MSESNCFESCLDHLLTFRVAMSFQWHCSLILGMRSLIFQAISSIPLIIDCWSCIAFLPLICCFFFKFWLDFFLFAFRARANWSWTWCAGGRRCASSACWNSTASFRSITSSSHAPSTRTRGASPIWWVPPFSLLFFFYLLLFLRLAASDVDGEYTDSFWNYFSLSQKGPDAFGPFFFQPTEKKLCSLNSTNTRFSNLIGVYFIRL